MFNPVQILILEPARSWLDGEVRICWIHHARAVDDNEPMWMHMQALCKDGQASRQYFSAGRAPVEWRFGIIRFSDG
jgi:hypothetical protein